MLSEGALSTAFVGVSALLLVFMVFVSRGMKVALQVDDGFSKLLAAGLTFSFGLQTFVIVGGIVRLIPLTGITLPFVSYGGSSIVANTFWQQHRPLTAWQIWSSLPGWSTLDAQGHIHEVLAGDFP